MAKALDRPAATYEGDFYGWALEQAAHLRAGRFDRLDVDNVAEELEGLARSEARELRSRYAVLLAHLLKWRYEPERQSNSWSATIRRERHHIPEHLAENPGLKPRRAELFAKAYRDARHDAAVGTGLDVRTFPEACPWTLEQAMDESFWPEPA
jgi:hypothetical protein